MTPKTIVSSDRTLDLLVKAAQGRKAHNMVLLEVGDLTSIADAFLICSGRSHRQVTAIAEHIIQTLKTHTIKPLSMEGLKEGQWVLLDYGHVIVHIFHDPVRDFYDLESLWIDAQKTTFDDPSVSDSLPTEEIL